MSELITHSPPKDNSPSFKNVSTLVGMIFGIVGVTAIFAVALFIPHPSHFQYGVFRSVLALSGAGVAGALPGMLSINIPRFLRLGGAFVVFGIMYFKTPATIILETIQRIRESINPTSEHVQPTIPSPKAAASPKVIGKDSMPAAATHPKGRTEESEFVIHDSEVPSNDPRKLPPPIVSKPAAIPAPTKPENPTPPEKPPGTPSKLKIIPN